MQCLWRGNKLPCEQPCHITLSFRCHYIPDRINSRVHWDAWGVLQQTVPAEVAAQVLAQWLDYTGAGSVHVPAAFGAFSGPKSQYLIPRASSYTRSGCRACHAAGLMAVWELVAIQGVMYKHTCGCMTGYGTHAVPKWLCYQIYTS